MMLSTIFQQRTGDTYTMTSEDPGDGVQSFVETFVKYHNRTHSEPSLTCLSPVLVLQRFCVIYHISEVETLLLRLRISPQFTRHSYLDSTSFPDGWAFPSLKQHKVAKYICTYNVLEFFASYVARLSLWNLIVSA